MQNRVFNSVRYVDVTLVCDTLINAAGDVLSDRVLVAGACPAVDVPCELVSAVVLDEDDNAAAAMDLYFLNANVTLGTVNAAISITDANARNILGVVPVAAADFKDLIASRLATVKNIGLAIKPVAGTADIYVAAVTAGTPTQTASGLKLRLGFK